MPGNLRNLSLPPKIFSLTSLLLILLIPCFCHSLLNGQGQALVAWKNTLNSTTSSASLAFSSWNTYSSPNHCKWFGVRCNSQGEVTEINLKSVNLQGASLPSIFCQPPLSSSLKILILSSTNITRKIPKEIGFCKELVVLDLSGNSLSGEIPMEIGTLTKLQSLFLHNNFLEGNIPSNIGNLTSLVNLTLFDNRMDGEIPRSIGFLRNLQVFRAGGNRDLEGEIPWEIGNCTGLVTLGLAETSVSGSIPSSIGMLKRLQTVAIYTALLSGSVPEEIGNCSELRNLYLYQNSISGSIPRGIGELRNLQSILLWQNNVVGTIPEELGSCEAIRVVDLSENLLTGGIPTSLGRLSRLRELQLSVNRLSGTIPPEITNCSSLSQLELDNNALSGEIPASIGSLRGLTLFFAWQNKLTGKIPESLSDCRGLEAIDLSYNNLIGPIPKQLFGLRNLTKLLLLWNNLSGSIPPDIGNCSSLYRLRLSHNRLAGGVPREIGKLENLNFFDAGNNRFAGEIPRTLSGCKNLEFLDLHSNGFTGSVPDSLPESLQLVDFSDNRLSGSLTGTVGSLAELTKLYLGRNRLSGRIPPEILSCTKLQLLDLGGNSFSGEIPKELGLVTSLEISLNLSSNQLSGEIPPQFSSLGRLGVLDLSHNKLSGSLDAISGLQNLVSLNVSFNGFSGELPSTQFFRELPLSNLAGNDGLYVGGGGIVTPADRTGSEGHARSAMKFITSILLSISAVLVLLTVYVLVRTRIHNKSLTSDDAWEITMYQKLQFFSIDDVVLNLTSANVIGTGSSGVVYRVVAPNGETLAVKKMWSSEECGAFDSEIRTLGSIRHKNIIRLLGWGSNKNLKLLFYDYLPNGSLSSLLHGSGKGRAEWETRYDVVLGVAHALSYLHHYCVPAIMHGDVKAMNVLLGHGYQPYLADFGLARIVVATENGGEDNTDSRPVQRHYLAGSYGYMAPEHASMQPITEKSDVYSFGMVLLEVLTGRHPLDPTLPGGAHLVQWVRNHLARKMDPSEILDQKLRGRDDPTMHEMLQTLAVAFLCVSTRADDRPSMKDVVAMLKEIKPVNEGSRAETNSDDVLMKKKGHSSLPPSAPTKNVVSNHASSNCSYNFSDESIS